MYALLLLVVVVVLNTPQGRYRRKYIYGTIPDKVIRA